METDKGERRASGSYYTPDHIVGYIVGKTLAPECHRISEKLRRDVENTEKMLAAASSEEARGKWEGRLAQLRSQYDDRILSLRVLDPAMGSGHFLLRACQFLAEEIATHPYASDPDCGATQTEEAAITFWKRRVVERCLYGVDINPLAVELAKLALWLETVATDQPLTFLDHHLRHGNSLVGADLPRLGARPMAGGAFEDAFGPQVAENLPALLKPLADIRQMPSETTAQVKEKEALYRKAFERARKPFVLVGDLWCSVYFMSEGAPDDAQYQSVIENLRKPASLKALTTEPWFSAAIERAL
ncbi:MAG: N-6 DNA methylase, partial [Candidatus Sumerlaeota bacterium]|nr:N-6 DNA methylase [Candidatus Sumerlaeota bacterium]